MASPQTENGYTKIANELLEALIAFRLKGTELAVVLFVARRSYGWSARKTKPLGVREMAEEMGDLPPASVSLAVQVLIENKVLIRDENRCYKVNKDYEAWVQSVQPAGRKVSSPLDKVSNPLDKTVQPAGQFHDGPKERKETKESIKGWDGQNGDTDTPSLAEIVEYASELNKRMDCRRFFDHYTANGWTRGKSRIADWKAVLRLWEDDGGAPIAGPKKKLCRCRRDNYYPEVKSRDGKTMICASCRQHEDIEAGVI